MQIHWSDSWLEFQNRANFSLVLGVPQLQQFLSISAREPERLDILGVPFRGVQSVFFRQGSLVVAGSCEILRFANILYPGRFPEARFDMCLVPNQMWFTAALDIVDVAELTQQRPIFASQKFSCVATVDPFNSFSPVWTPHFIQELKADFACGLSGLAMRVRQPTHVTCFGNSAEPLQWKTESNGLLIDMETGDYVCEGLSLPRFPRWHRGQLYMVEAGSGYFGQVNCQTGEFVRLALCPGYVQGVSFVSDYAVIVVGSPRAYLEILVGRSLIKNCEKESLPIQSGVFAINLKTGERLEGIVIDEGITDVQGLVLIENCHLPHIVSLASPDLSELLTGGGFQPGWIA